MVRRPPFLNRYRRSSRRSGIYRQRFWIRLDLLRCALGNNAAAVHARTGTNVHHIVHSLDGVLIVFDSDHRVAEIAQPPRRIEQAGVVALSAEQIDGSSSTYSTLVNPEPIFDASRMRWLSPPDRVPDQAGRR